MAKTKEKKAKKEKVKVNQRTKNSFIKIISAMLVVIIACTSINLFINKATANVVNNNVSGGDIYNGGDIQQGDANVIQNGDVIADDGSTVAQGDSSATASGNGTVSNQGTTANSKTNTQSTGSEPTSYSKAQLVTYYNTCLKKAYSQPKFTVTKTEVIDVQLGDMLLNGKPATGIQSMANSVVESNKKKGGTKTQQFTSSTAVVNAQDRFILPANLTAAAVKSASASKSGSGYVVSFTLNAERCNFTTKPPYNSSCTFPLDFNEIDLGNLGQITSAEFYYPGTTLTATIDGQGRVVKTYVVMPLSVDDAKGQGMGQELQVDISGKWLCTNVNTF